MDFDFFNSNKQIPYPFKDRLTVERGAAIDADISNLFVSATARLSDLDEERLSLLNMHVLSSTTFPTIQSAVTTLKWIESGTTISLDDSDADTTFMWSAYGDWAVFNWVKGVEIAIQFVIPIAVITTNGGNEEFVIGYDAGYTPQTAIAYEFQQSRVLAGPNRVRRVYVKQEDSLTLVAENGEDILIQPGFNMQLEAQDPEATTGRQLTRIAINAVPGAGRGRYLLCPGRQYLYTINGVGPDDDGRSALAPEECYWLELPLRSGPTPIPESHGLTEQAAVRPHTLQLHNSCGPCCSCEDYIKAYDNLRNIWNRARAQAELYQTLRSTYSTLLADYLLKFNDQTLSIEKYDDITIRVVSTYVHTEADEELKFEFEFDLPDGVALAYIPQSGVFASSITGAFLKDPTDPNGAFGNPYVEITDETFVENVRSHWSGLWQLVGIEEEDEVELAVVITDGETASASKSITW